MSGSFREIGRASFMWQALDYIGDGSDDEGREDLTRLLGSVYRALAPLEKACAWVEDSDSAPSRLPVDLLEHGEAALAALDSLARYIRADRERSKAIIEAAVRPSTGKAEPPTPFEAAPANVTQLAPKRE